MAEATMVGPANRPNNPNDSKTSSTPINSRMSFKLVRFRKAIGRTMLSATVNPPPQISTTSKAFPQCPVNPSHSAAGPQMSAEPTTGTSEKNAISTPQKIGDESFTSANDTPPSTP